MEQICVSYSRVSTKAQKTKRQELDISEWAAKKEIIIEKEFEETGSGKKERPVFNEMLEYVKKNNIKLIVCSELSRFGRSITDVLYHITKLDKLGVEVFFIDRNTSTKDKNSKVSITMLSLIADMEGDFIKERMLSGKRISVKEGKRMSTPVITYGYKVDTETKKYVLHPFESKIVNEIYEMRSEGKSIRNIALYLYTKKIPTRNTANTKKWVDGKPPSWGTNNVTKILRNPVYASGKNHFLFKVGEKGRVENEGGLVERIIKNKITNEQVTYLYESIEYYMPPIINKKLWDSVQETFKDVLNYGNSRIIDLHVKKEDRENNNFDNNKYLFRGKIKCGRCKLYYGAKTEKKNSIKHPNWNTQSSYYCFNRKNIIPGKKCYNGQFHAALLDDIFWYLLTSSENFIEKRLAEELESYDFEATNKRIESFRQDFKDLKLQIARTGIRFDMGHIEEQELKNLVEPIQNEMTKIANCISGLENELEQNVKKQEIINNVFTTARERRTTMLLNTNNAAFANMFVPEIETNEKGIPFKREYVEKYVKEIKLWRIDVLNFNFADTPRQLYDIKNWRKNRQTFKANDSIVYAEMIAFDESIKLKCVLSTSSKNYYANNDLELKIENNICTLSKNE